MVSNFLTTDVLIMRFVLCDVTWHKTDKVGFALRERGGRQVYSLVSHI